MTLKYLLATSALALSVGLATPALAQNTNDNTNTNTNNTNTQNSSSSASAASASATSNGFTYDLDLTYDNSLDYDLDIEYDSSLNYDLEISYDVELNYDSSEHYGDGSASRGGEVEADAENGSAAAVNGDATNIDVEDVNVASEGSNAAAQGGEIDTVASGDGSVAASRGGEVEIGNAEDSNNIEDSYNSGNIVAEQELTAIITNNGEFAEIVEDAQGYNSGYNRVEGNAFSAFAGILNQAWNTGVNANTQAATNIAASGTVNFVSDDAPGNSGNPGNGN